LGPRDPKGRAKNGGTTLYLHVWDWPADGKILLPTFKELPTSGVLLKGGAAVTAERTADGIVIQLPGKATDPDVSVARLEFPGALTITQEPCNTPAADGTLTLPALDADPHGAVGGNLRIEGSGANAYLTDWKQQEYRVEYHVKTGKAAKWNIKAEIAAAEPAKLSSNRRQSTQPSTSPPPEAASHGKPFRSAPSNCPRRKPSSNSSPCPTTGNPSICASSRSNRRLPFLRNLKEIPA
jgi:hypothetical protein